VALGGEEIVGTVLFTDVEGFTGIAERLGAVGTAKLLNGYFSQLTRAVFYEQGTLIKYIGDAVFAIWGAPVPQADHARRAGAGALAMSATMGDGEIGTVAAAGAGDRPGLRTRVGVHTGRMLVGNLGSEQRFDYTAIGDAVNVAFRLEGLNRLFGTQVIASS